MLINEAIELADSILDDHGCTDEQEDAIRTLIEVAESLHKTADGERIFGNMTLYNADGIDPDDDCVETVVSSFWIGADHAIVFDDMNDELNLDVWYSTPEAARRG